jgi:hypothetical protein
MFIVINTETHSRDLIRQLIVDDVEFCPFECHVGGTTIKRVGVGDAARGDQRESGFSSGCRWSPSPARRADFLLVALAKG